MTIILASKTTFLDHALHSRLLIHDSIGDAQRTKKRFGHLLEHEKLRSRDAAVISEVASVGGQNQNRRAVNHAHLRQSPSADQQASDASHENHPPSSQRGAGAEGKAVAFASH